MMTLAYIFYAVRQQGPSAFVLSEKCFLLVCIIPVFFRGHTAQPLHLAGTLAAGQKSLSDQMDAELVKFAEYHALPQCRSRTPDC
jgi:hypothetical protein